MSFKVCHIGNFGSGHCGIRNFAEQTSIALRRAGCEVTDWDGEYSTLHAREERQEDARYPADIETYDVLHFTWHPLAINHYGEGHFTPVKGSLLSIYLTDLPPWSGCPCVNAFPVRMSAETHEILATPTCPGLVLPYPIIDWVTDLPPPDPAFTVGWTGIRGDGRQVLKEVCEKHGWAMNFTSDDPNRPWLSIEEEVRRLARSTVNVCWYWDQRNLAGAPSTCLASRRPLLLNGSAMFTHLRPYADELYIEYVSQTDVAVLDAALFAQYVGHKYGQAPRTPSRIYRDLGWTRAAHRMIQCWQEAQ